MIGRLCGSEKGESTHGKVRAEGRFLSGTSEAVAAAYMFEGRTSGGHSGRVPSVMCAVWRSDRHARPRRIVGTRLPSHGTRQLGRRWGVGLSPLSPRTHLRGGQFGRVSGQVEVEVFLVRARFARRSGSFLA